MNERDEKLSALLDNALDRKELNEFMRDLKRDPVADAECMQRYRIISDTMRDDLSEVSLMDISARVHRAIEQEESLQVSIRPAARLFNFPALVKPLTGMAIAASVAMVTVVAVRTVNTDTDVDALQAVANVDQSPARERQAAVTPINPIIAQQVRTASTDASQQTRLRNIQLSEYMMNHSGYAGQAMVPGMVPYVRVVTFDAESKR